MYSNLTVQLKETTQDSSTTSVSLPFPLLTTGIGGEALEGLPVPLLCPVLANCHAGMVGLPDIGRGDEGMLPGPRLSNSAFSDFNSCCSSAKD
jgi:hypothetical protein